MNEKAVKVSKTSQKMSKIRKKCKKALIKNQKSYRILTMNYEEVLIWQHIKI